MESEDSSDDDESRLYSLIHYSVDGIPEEIAIPASKGECSTPLYESKYSKVSRLDAVKSIIGMNSESKNQNQESELVNNYRSLLYEYKAARFGHAFGWSNRRRNFDDAPRKSVNKQNSQQARIASTPVNSEKHTNRYEKPLDKNSKSNTSYRERISLNYQSPLQYSTDIDVNKNQTQDGNKSHKEKSVDGNSGKSNNKTVDSNKNQSNVAKNKKANEKNDKNVSNDEIGSSKYNLVLSKDKQNCSDESVIVLDSESDPESIVEVMPPVREPPPVVSLTSDEEDIVILCTGVVNDGKQSSPGAGIQPSFGTAAENRPSSPSADVLNTEREIGSSLGELENALNYHTEESAVKKKKKKKKKRKNKDKKSQKSSSSSAQRTPNLKKTRISPSTWTKDMSRFYNKSWGGENFDCRQLQQNMSDNRFSWRISYADVIGQPWRMGSDFTKKCTNCNVRGHANYNCPFPKKPTVCLFCGMTGHSQYKCPAPICLTCGRPSERYKEDCSKCFSTEKQKQCCLVCEGVHLTDDCPDTWRKYHAMTSQVAISSGSSKGQYKPNTEQFCCHCTRKGHRYDECQQISGQPFKSVSNPAKRPYHSPYERNKFAKRRKFNNGGFCYPQVNTFFRPFYNAY